MLKGVPKRKKYYRKYVYNDKKRKDKDHFMR